MDDGNFWKRLMHYTEKSGAGCNSVPAEKWGVVLSGGGTKGAYEVGAWRAIKELEIPVRGITGTSIGALNAAMFLGCELKDIEEIYRTINISDVLPVSGNIDPDKDVFDPANLLAITKEYIANRGLTNAPLRRMLELHLDIEKVYASPMDLGIVTYDIYARVPMRIFKEDIEKNKLIDYLLASANFPIYKTQNVDGKRFMDGGLYDNMPFNLLIDRGYTHLIVIDINGPGETQKVDQAGSVYLKKITASEDLGGTFDFNRQRMNKNVKLGYLDTMKAFHRLFGNYYFFSPKAFNELLMNFDLKTIYGLETAARQYGVPRYEIYETDEFLRELEDRYDVAETEYKRSASGRRLRPDIREIRRLTQPGTVIAAFADMLMEQPGIRGGAVMKAFPEAEAAARAMIELKNFRKL